MKGSATWESTAGEAFGARLGEVPPLLDAVSARLGGAAGPLGAGRCDGRGAAGRGGGDPRRLRRAGDVRPVGRPRVRAGEHRAGRGLTRRSRRPAPAAGAATGSGRRPALGTRAPGKVPRGRPPVLDHLRALSEDAPTDSGFYRLAAGASTVGRDLSSVGSVAAVVPQLKGVAFIGERPGPSGTRRCSLPTTRGRGPTSRGVRRSPRPVGPVGCSRRPAPRGPGGRRPGWWSRAPSRPSSGSRWAWRLRPGRSAMRSGRSSRCGRTGGRRAAFSAGRPGRR